MLTNAESNLAFSYQRPLHTAIQQNKTIFLSCVRAQLNHHFNVSLLSIRTEDTRATSVVRVLKQEIKNKEVEGKRRKQLPEEKCSFHFTEDHLMKGREGRGGTEPRSMETA